MLTSVHSAFDPLNLSFPKAPPSVPNVDRAMEIDAADTIHFWSRVQSPRWSGNAPNKETRLITDANIRPPQEGTRLFANDDVSSTMVSAGWNLVLAKNTMTTPCVVLGSCFFRWEHLLSSFHFSWARHLSFYSFFSWVSKPYKCIQDVTRTDVSVNNSFEKEVLRKKSTEPSNTPMLCHLNDFL